MNKEKYQNLDQYDLDECLIKACKSKDMALVKYLLTSPELSKHADINTQAHGEKGLPLRNALIDKDLALAKYLLTSDELTEHADIHVGNDSAFIVTFLRNYNAGNYNDILEFLIFDCKINRTKDIDNFLNESKNTPHHDMAEYVEKLFKIRSVNNELNNELNSENTVKQDKPKL
jgi:hypothetical protein